MSPSGPYVGGSHDPWFRRKLAVAQRGVVEQATGTMVGLISTAVDTMADLMDERREQCPLARLALAVLDKAREFRSELEDEATGEILFPSPCSMISSGPARTGQNRTPIPTSSV